jgi:hypothetical protein
VLLPNGGVIHEKWSTALSKSQVVQFAALGLEAAAAVTPTAVRAAESRIRMILHCTVSYDTGRQYRIAKNLQLKPEKHWDSRSFRYDVAQQPFKGTVLNVLR